MKATLRATHEATEVEHRNKVFATRATHEATAAPSAWRRIFSVKPRHEIYTNRVNRRPLPLLPPPPHVNIEQQADQRPPPVAPSPDPKRRRLG